MRRTLTFIVALAVAASAAQSVFAVFFDDAAYYEKRNFCVNHAVAVAVSVPGPHCGATSRFAR